MKVLTIPEESDFNLGHYDVACEGFVDVLKSMFSGERSRKKMVAKIKNTKWPLALRDLDENLKWTLSATYQNPHWIKENLPEKSTTIQVPSLVYANASGKELTHPSEILKIAQSMVVVFKNIIRVEKPFIELRVKLMNQMNKASGNREEAADKLWLENKNVLMTTSATRYLKQDKKDHPALGRNSRTDGEWPVPFKGSDDGGFSATGPRFKTSGSIEAPSQDNAQEYAVAIRSIVDMIREVLILSQECYIDDLEGFDINYNELKYGDDIFTHVCCTDSRDDVQHLGYYIHHVFSIIACGLYVTMFDKHEVPVK